MGNHNTNMNPQKQSYYSVEYLNGEFSLDALDSFNNPHLNSNIDRTLIDASRPTTAVGARNNSTASSSLSTESSTNEAAHREMDDEMVYGDGGCQHELTYSTSSSSAQSGGRNNSHGEIRGRNRSSRANIETTRRVSASVDRHINLCVNNSQQIGVSPTLLMKKGAIYNGKSSGKSNQYHYQSAINLIDNENDNDYEADNNGEDQLDGLNTNPLGLVRNGAVLVQRSKSYVRPENKVLPIEFPQRPLRQTNLLKTDGAKRTWRAAPNHNRAASILVGATNSRDTDTNKNNNNATLIYGDNHIKPSLIKSLLIMNNQTKTRKKNSSRQTDHDATSNDELTDFDDNHQTRSAWTLNNESVAVNSKATTTILCSPSSTSSSSSSVDNLKNVRNEIKNFREKYSRSMGNIVDDGWHCDDSTSNQKNDVMASTSHQSPLLQTIGDRMEADRFNVDIEKLATLRSNKKDNNETSLSSTIKKSRSITAAAHSAVSSWSLANKLKVATTQPKSEKITNNIDEEKLENMKILKKLKSKSFLSQIKQNFGPVSQMNQSRLLSRKANNKLSKKEQRNFNDEMINNENSINVTTDIQIISRFPINSKVYRHYISGNGNKADKLTNSVEVKNVLRIEEDESCANETNHVSFMGENERGIDVNDEPLLTTQTCAEDEFEPTYDSIDECGFYQNLNETNDQIKQQEKSSNTSNSQKEEKEVKLAVCEDYYRYNSSSSSVLESSACSSSSSSKKISSNESTTKKMNKPQRTAPSSNNNTQQFLSPSASSVFSSVLTASSILPSTSSNESTTTPNKKKTQQIITKDELEKNSSVYNNDEFMSGEVYERPLDSSLKFIDESVYEILSNANSGNNSTANIMQKQDNIHVFFNPRKPAVANKVDEVKQALFSGSRAEITTTSSRENNNPPTKANDKKATICETKINIKSRIDLFENRSNQEERDKAIAAKNERIIRERASEDLIKAFYLKPPTNYDDDHELYLVDKKNKTDKKESLNKNKQNNYRRYNARDEILNVAEDYANDIDDDYNDEDEENYEDEPSADDRLSCFDFIDLIDCNKESLTTTATNTAKYTFYPPATNVTNLTDDDNYNEDEEEIYGDDDEDECSSTRVSAAMRFVPPPSEFDTAAAANNNNTTNSIMTSSFTFQKYFHPQSNCNSSDYSTTTNKSDHDHSCSSSSSSSASPSSCSNKTKPVAATNNFILKPKIQQQTTHLKVPEIRVEKAAVENNNNKATKSAPKGRRKGLEEVFPDIKLSMQQAKSTSNITATTTTRLTLNEYNYNPNNTKNISPAGPNEYTKIYWTDESHSNSSKQSSSSSSSTTSSSCENDPNRRFNIQDPNWCPASDLCDDDFDVECEDDDEESDADRMATKKERSNAANNKDARIETYSVKRQNSQQIKQPQTQQQQKQQPLNKKLFPHHKSSDVFLPVKNINTFYY